MLYVMYPSPTISHLLMLVNKIEICNETEKKSTEVY